MLARDNRASDHYSSTGVNEPAQIVSGDNGDTWGGTYCGLKTPSGFPASASSPAVLTRDDGATIDIVTGCTNSYTTLYHGCVPMSCLLWANTYSQTFDVTKAII